MSGNETCRICKIPFDSCAHGNQPKPQSNEEIIKRIEKAERNFDKLRHVNPPPREPSLRTDPNAYNYPNSVVWMFLDKSDQLEARVGELEAKCETLYKSRKDVVRDMDRISKSYNFDQQNLKDQKETIARLEKECEARKYNSNKYRDALKKIANECDHGEHSNIAKQALNGKERE